MFRFLRRVLILLILFVIIFFIFRLIKPEATNRFVDKVKEIPTTVSSRFHREKKSKIIINGDTTFSSDPKIDNNTDNNYIINDENYIIDTDNSNNSNTTTNDVEQRNNDLEWLQELNREIEAILASGDSEEGVIEDAENEPKIMEIERKEGEDSTERLEIIELEPGAIEQPEPTGTLAEIIGEVLSENQTNTSTQTTSTKKNTSTTNSQKNTNTSSTKQKCGSCSDERNGKCLSEQDCEDLARDFWNYN